MRKRRAIPVACLALVALIIAHPAAGADCEFGRTAIFTTNSAWLRLNSDVLSGDVIVNDASEGPTLFPGHELGVGLYATTPAGFAVKADSIRVRATAALGGDVFCNDLTDGSGDVTCQPLPLPVCDNLPAFQAAAPRPGAPDVLVPFKGSDTLAPGDYGEIQIRWRGSLTFLGGIYNVAEIDAGVATEMRFLAPTEIRVAGKLMIDLGSTVGPAAGSGVTAADIVFYVAGINGTSGNLWALPRAARSPPRRRGRTRAPSATGRRAADILAIPAGQSGPSNATGRDLATNCPTDLQLGDHGDPAGAEAQQDRNPERRAKRCWESAVGRGTPVRR